MGSVRVAIVGVGNCATSLIQGVHYYRDADPSGTVPGLMWSSHRGMAFKLLEAAQDRWRAVNGPHLVALVRAGATFHKGC